MQRACRRHQGGLAHLVIPMLFSDLRVALWVVYAVLIVWRVSVGAPEGYWPYTLGFAVLMGITRAIEQAAHAGRLERDVAYLASLDPASAQERIGHLWSAHARRTYRELLLAEGSVEEARGVERFPYARSERRAADHLFWVAVAAAAVAFALLFTVARGGAWLPWVLWVSGGLCVAFASWARQRGSELASTLELSRFSLTHTGQNGRRRSVRWQQALVLQNQPRRRRVLLAAANGSVAIPLGYRRVGFERLLRLTIEYGGFSADPASEQDAATGAQTGA